MKQKCGKVYLVGAGPGKADLITVRGYKILKEADVVIYDYLVGEDLLTVAREGAELISCRSLRDSSGVEDPIKRQVMITDIIVQKSKEGKRVVRLKGGDPALFSRASHELHSLVKENIEFEIVPGVTAASAASSFTGIMLTDRDTSSGCIFIAGQEAAGKEESLIDWESLSKTGTIVFYMGVGNLKAIAEKLIFSGKNKNTPVAIVQNISYPQQVLITGDLGGIADKAIEKGIKPPAVVIVGESVKNEELFNWHRKNKRVLFTGLSEDRFFSEGSYEHVPLIKIERLSDYSDFDGALKDLEEYDWIVFTSKYGVKYFFERLREVGCDARDLSGVKIAAIGRATEKVLNSVMIDADLVPKNESSVGLIDKFKKIDIKKSKIFIPRSELSDSGLVESLRSMGAEVTAKVAYKNVIPDNLPELNVEDFDEVMFTSPSTVRNFKKRYGKVPSSVRISCIGDITFEEAERCGLVTSKA